MEVVAKTKYIRISPKKLRELRHLILGKDVSYAIDILKNLPKRGAKVYIKTINSAVANGNQKVQGSEWKIKNILVEQGPTYKRYRAAPMGRAVMVRKRTAHLVVILEEIEGEKHGTKS